MLKLQTVRAIFLLLLILFPIGKVVAGLSITPAFIRLDSIKQGKPYKFNIVVTNQSAKKTEHFKSYAEAPHNEINGLPADKVLSWIKVKPSKFSLQPGQRQKVRVALKVPKGYEGDYRIHVAIQQDPKKYNIKFKKRNLNNKVGVMQLGKTSTRLPEFKTHVKSLVKINVPVVIRAIKSGKKIKLRTKQAKFGKFSLSASKAKGSAMSLSTTFTNKARFDVVVQGSCAILNKNGSKKLMEVSLQQKILVQPKQMAPIVCNFNSALPKGRYKAQGNFSVSVKGATALVKINKRQKLKVSAELSSQIAGLGSAENIQEITTPLLLSPSLIEQQVFGGKIRKIMVDVVNPTSKKITVRSKFRLTNNNRIKAKIKPSKFKLGPGESKTILIDIKNKDKKSPVYGWLEFSTNKSKGALPASIPVILKPDGWMIKHKAKLSPLNATLTSRNSRLLFVSKISNSKDGSDAIYLLANITVTNIETGIIEAAIKGALSKDILLPGDNIKLSAGVDFDKLKDGVYEVLIKVSSEEGKLNLNKKTNIVINRDVANKVKVIVNE